jgi:hypothetical protein
MTAKAFYVYELVDPRFGEVFYVGKGTRDRLSGHKREARGGGRSLKCERFREIWSDGQEVECRIIERFEREADAYLAEKALIEKIGLSNLTNMIAGGGGLNPLHERQRAVSKFRELCTAVVRLEPFKSQSLIVCSGAIQLRDIIADWKAQIAALCAQIGLDEAKNIAASRGVSII